MIRIILYELTATTVRLLILSVLEPQAMGLVINYCVTGMHGMHMFTSK